MTKNNLITTLLVGVVVGLLLFYGGTIYQKTKVPNFRSGQFIGRQMDRNTPPRNGTGNQFGRPINGQITSIEDKTITIKSADGSSKIIVYSDSTVVNKTDSGSLSDLKVGQSIMVIGQEGGGGITTAQTISVGGNFPLPTLD